MLRALIVGTVFVTAGCGRIAMAPWPTSTSCRTSQSVPVRWILPDDDGDRRQLSLWCDAVGQAAYYQPPNRVVDTGVTALTVVSWNAAVGRGRIHDLIADTRTQYPDSALVVLVQEAYRTGGVPVECAPQTRRARRIGRGRRENEILDAARDTAMYALYIPSMRNGEDCREEPREDRGNAILSTLPLDDATAIELPVARQRRVAVAASIRVAGAALWVATVHLDTSPFAHKRQAEALVEGLEPIGRPRNLIVGGDFNAALPDPGLMAIRRHFREVHCGDDPTHGFPAFRLDRLFRDGDVLTTSCVTAGRSYGSDHWPLIARATIRAHAGRF